MTEEERQKAEEAAAQDQGPSDLADEEIEILEYEGSSERDEESPEAPAAAPAAPGAERELAEHQERYLRLRADFENFRKRIEREREEVRRYALAEPLRELLPVLDNLERAATAQGQLADLQRGVEMIARQIAETLKRFGLAEVTALGAPFDPRVHEAVAREESEVVATPTVVAELQRGYRLHERLLRPAMVRVAVPVDRAAEDAPADGADEVEAAAGGAEAGEDA